MWVPFLISYIVLIFLSNYCLELPVTKKKKKFFSKMSLLTVVTLKLPHPNLQKIICLAVFIAAVVIM